MYKLYSFDEFVNSQSGSTIVIDESKNTDSIIIGDSQTPLIANGSEYVRLLSNKGSEEALWKGGMGLSWLKGAVSNYKTDPNVANVVICIGTNGRFNTNDDISGLFRELRRAFPNAKFYAIQGSWGWGGNKDVTEDQVKKYYDLFKDQGAKVLEPPIGKVEPHDKSLPVYKEIRSAIARAISNPLAPEDEVLNTNPKKESSTEESPNDIKHFQRWLDKNIENWAWGYPGGIVGDGPGYGKFGPRTKSAWEKYKKEYLSQLPNMPDKPKENSSKIDIILGAGLDNTYNKSYYSLDKQEELLKKPALNKFNLVSYKYDNFTPIKEAILNNPDAYVVLFSYSGGAYAEKAASIMKDPKKLFILEPFYSQGRSGQSNQENIKSAISLGLPPSNVHVGPVEARGFDIISNPSYTNLESHWDALPYIGKILAAKLEAKS